MILDYLILVRGKMGRVKVGFSQRKSRRVGYSKGLMGGNFEVKIFKYKNIFKI